MAATSAAFLTRRYYDAIAQHRIRLLLGAIDHQLRHEDPNEPPATINYDSLQIEHVMPKSWKAHWPIVRGDGAVVETDESDPLWTSLAVERTRAVDRIGNLTLVTGTFNRGVSNLGWSSKKPEFEKQKSLVINYGIAQSDVWDEAQMAARSKQLASAVCRLWPSPETLLSAVEPAQPDG